MATEGGGGMDRDALDRLTPAGRNRPPSAPMTRPCKTCGELFVTRCTPRVVRRTDGTETVRWLAEALQCENCQPTLFGELL